MNKEPKPVTFAGTIDDIVREAVEGEKERCLTILRNAFHAESSGSDSVASLRKCLVEIRDVATKPEPPAEEPMTIAWLIRKLRLRINNGLLETEYHWTKIENDLQALVEVQTRRCATFLKERSQSLKICGHPEHSKQAASLADELLESAGLE